ncbi:unnamed protein product [Cylicostephanus goldi]|uniref:Uncharacterized protein n=1 Tax=Cylicostephanus goldi TaxID=71465 RepID=A0A3P6SP43_CYLGO|nr:unnamed protein product [Cylicostephanus goldi]
MTHAEYTDDDDAIVCASVHDTSDDNRHTERIDENRSAPLRLRESEHGKDEDMRNKHNRMRPAGR